MRTPETNCVANKGRWWRLAIWTRLVCMLSVCGLALAASAALNLTGLSPTNGATNICPDTLLRITFDAAPQFTNSGRITIYTSAGVPMDTNDMSLCINKTGAPNVQTRTIAGTTYYTYPIIVSGNTATIYPHLGVLTTNLTTNQAYYVSITPGLFTNSSSGAFAGIADSNIWSFTTRPANPADGTNHLVVAADGSGDFCTVQGALDFLPAGSNPVLINIRNGVYEEIVYLVNTKHNIKFRGESRAGTIITYRNNANLNSTRYLFWMRGDGVAMENLTLTNSTPRGGSQAEALRADGRRFIFNHGKLASYQDTLLLNSFGRYSYFYDSLIQGDTDYIWNDGIGVFQDCAIKTLNSGYTCQMRSEAAPYKGAVFLDCAFTKAYNFSGHYFARINQDEYPNSVVALINCKLDDHIHPTGWLATGGGATSNLRFWEYQSTDLTGTNLVDVSGRAAFSRQLNAAEAAALRNLTNVYAPNALWLPQLAPNIISQPTNQTVAVGSNATFTVQATGIETTNPAAAGSPSLIVPPRYQWRKNGTNYAGATNASLTISNVQPADAGSYSLVVSNLSGSMVSSNALLVVAGPSQPVIESALFTNGQFRLIFKGDPGLNYGVQRSTNLTDWQTVFSTNAPALPFLWTDMDATVPERYFRILGNP